MLGLFLAGKTDKSFCQCPPSWKTTWKICKKFCYSGYCSPKNWLISHRNMTRERKAWLVIKKERDLSTALNQGCQIRPWGQNFTKPFTFSKDSNHCTTFRKCERGHKFYTFYNCIFILCTFHIFHFPHR